MQRESANGSSESVLTEVECYYIIEAPTEWMVEFDNQGLRRAFASRDRALSAAREAAEARWLMTGFATCVRIGSSKDLSTLDLAFGPR